MVTMTIAQMVALEVADLPAMTEVGVAPTVVTGVEVLLIHLYRTQVGKVLELLLLFKPLNQSQRIIPLLYRPILYWHHIKNDTMSIFTDGFFYFITIDV